MVSPEQLEYRNGVLRRGEFTIDIVYRRIRLQEFLVRFDLTHPLVRAYKDHAVCMVNSFRAEMGAKTAMFDLLTDDAVTAKFPAAGAQGDQGLHSVDAPGAGGQDHAQGPHRGSAGLRDEASRQAGAEAQRRFAGSAFFPRRGHRRHRVGRKRCARPCALRTWCRKSPSRPARCSR